MENIRCLEKFEFQTNSIFFFYKCSMCDEGSGPFERVFQWAWYLEITKHQAQRKLPGACFDWSVMMTIILKGTPQGAYFHVLSQSRQMWDDANSFPSACNSTVAFLLFFLRKTLTSSHWQWQCHPKWWLPVKDGVKVVVPFGIGALGSVLLLPYLSPSPTRACTHVKHKKKEQIF